MRRYRFLLLAASVLTIHGTAQADIIAFDTDPFLGSNALTTPGRQIVGGELFLSFNPATDTFAFESTAFGVNQLSFFNGLAQNVPGSGVNVVVLQNSETPFNAGLAANLIATQITVPTPGFFIYFNSGLDLPRLVYSIDLSDNTADLKILARLTNLSGQTGRDALPTFNEANFVVTTNVPAPPAFLLMMSGGGAWICTRLLRRRFDCKAAPKP